MVKGKNRSPLTVAIFTIITCGIYGLYWFYSTTLETQVANGEPAHAGRAIVLSLITCGIYYLYWVWRTSTRISELQGKVGLPVKSHAARNIVLSLLGLVIIVYPLMQSSLNKVWNAVK